MTENALLTKEVNSDYILLIYGIGNTMYNEICKTIWNMETTPQFSDPSNHGDHSDYWFMEIN